MTTFSKALTQTLRRPLRVLFPRHENMPVHNLTPLPARVERDVIARAYARLFDTDDGRMVMAHLQGQTLLRALTPDAPDSHIRFAEGQRAIVHTMLRFVAIGRGH